MKLLILGSQILAADPEQTDAEFIGADVIYPKHVIPGYVYDDFDVEADFDPKKWAYQNGVLVLKDAPPPSPPIVPSSVTRRRALQALFLAGVTEQDVIDKISLLPSPHKELALIEFKESLEFERKRPLVIQLGVALGLNLDTLFIAAAALP